MNLYISDYNESYYLPQMSITVSSEDKTVQPVQIEYSSELPADIRELIHSICVVNELEPEYLPARYLDEEGELRPEFEEQAAAEAKEQLLDANEFLLQELPAADQAWLQMVLHFGGVYSQAELVFRTAKKYFSISNELMAGYPAESEVTLQLYLFERSGHGADDANTEDEFVLRHRKISRELDSFMTIALVNTARWDEAERYEVRVLEYTTNNECGDGESEDQGKVLESLVQIEELALTDKAR